MISAASCVMALLLVGAVTWYNLGKARERAEQSERETLQSLAAATAGRLDQFILDSEQRTQSLAADKDVQALLNLAPAVLRTDEPSKSPGLSDEERRVVLHVEDTLREISRSFEDDHGSRRSLSDAPSGVMPSEAVFVNVYTPNGSKFGGDEPPEKRSDRRDRLNFRNAAEDTAQVDVSSLHVALSRPGASFFHLTKAVTGADGAQLGTVTFAISGTLLSSLVPDLGGAPAYDSAEARARANLGARPTATTRCTPPGKRPGAREVFLVDRFGAILLPSNCAGKDQFFFLDEAGRDAALHARNDKTDDYDPPFDVERIDGTHGSVALMAKLKAALPEEQRFFQGESARSGNAPWSREERRQSLFSGMASWDESVRLFGMHPVREARNHGWHVVYTEDIEDVLAPLRAEQRVVFWGIGLAALFGAAFVIGLARFALRKPQGFGEAIPAALETSESPVAMIAESRTVTILVSDVRGFSSICEPLSASQAIALLNHYLREMTAIVAKHGGVIHECIGDTMFALFDAPSEGLEHATRAVSCGTEMQLAMANLNELTRQEQLPELNLAIGIHTGEAVVGRIGIANRAKYGVLGRTVKLAQRIEARADMGQVLVSRATLDAADPNTPVGDEIVVSLGGTEPELGLFELIWQTQEEPAP